MAEWANAAWDAPGPQAPWGNQSVVMVLPHSRTHDIAQMLERKGVIKNALVFEFDLRIRGLADKIKAGEYAIPSEAPMRAVAAILVAGKSIQHKLTAAEGLTSEMIWRLVQKDDVLTGDAGPVPPEGTLLPETYLFTRGETRAHLLAKMAKAQDVFLAQKWEARASGLPLASIREAVILASIVEKETSHPEERRHIAAIFINRLKMGMRLQTDPTIIYDLTKGYPLGRGIRQSELAAATPHNTYVIAGLPPSPICNPGKDSITAVLAPETSADLYFVATGHGGHAFAATIAEQERNVAAYRAFERQQQPLESGPESRQVTVSERVENPAVPVPDAATPKLPALHNKRARHHK
ncbi:MAG: endolytic transglycosylase MltG [Alphaproteobacteria bacterium]|nr:endolytic transglycosylase MltG [Alphaproteobacteria bacterium]